MHSVMWRRIDRTGMETCAIVDDGPGHIISGTALYLDQQTPMRLTYSVSCDAGWRCHAALVERWAGADKTTIGLQQTDDGHWQANGQVIDGVKGLSDIDLGFTPATNTNAIKRLNLNIGDCAELSAVWLDDATWTFKPLKQRYERITADTYKYLSIKSGYQTVLTVDTCGLVRTYPDLWETLIS